MVAQEWVLQHCITFPQPYAYCPKSSRNSYGHDPEPRSRDLIRLHFVCPNLPVATFSDATRIWQAISRSVCPIQSRSSAFLTEEGYDQRIAFGEHDGKEARE